MNDNKLFSQDGNIGGFTPPPPPPSYGSPQFNQNDKASSSAIWALVLGIASWVFCGIFAAVPAWIIGKGEIKRIDAGQSSAAGRSMAVTGMWLGIAQVIIGVLALIGIGVYFLFIVALADL